MKTEIEKEATPKEIVEKRLKLIDMILIHMAQDKPDSETRKISRDAIRANLSHIRTQLKFPPGNNKRLPSGVCPMCDRRIGIVGRIPGNKEARLKKKNCLLDNRRDMMHCPYCGSQQYSVKKVGDRCDDGRCRAIVVEYFHRPTWKRK